MENKMPLLWKIKCRVLWNIVYHLQVKHWHGAAPDSWFSHLAIEVAGEETSNEWLEAVSDEDYGKLK